MIYQRDGKSLIKIVMGETYRDNDEWCKPWWSMSHLLQQIMAAITLDLFIHLFPSPLQHLAVFSISKWSHCGKKVVTYFCWLVSCVSSPGIRSISEYQVIYLKKLPWYASLLLTKIFRYFQFSNWNWFISLWPSYKV